jgi:tetratricopeptide (TPR) repeat protein
MPARPPGDRFSRLRTTALLPLCALLLGCPPRVDDRVREFTEDGVHLYERGDYAHARETFEYALTLEPGDANLLFNVGQCHERLGKADKAQEYYQLCLRKSANHAACRHALALLMFRNGRRDEADQLIQEWLATEPKLPDALVEDGWRLRQEGQLELALGRFQEALRHDPKHIRALTELGILYEVYQMPERSLDLYQRALAQNPSQPELAERVRVLRARGVSRPKPD